MPNRLSGETSPYLRQHADNPVDWQPWNADALALARAEDRPILLSIGYSACHWCHVMAHESFADEATAALMNAHFVNIKVDREERPDLDQIYQTAHQMLTGRAGGWPLTLFLTPAGVPFFGGTYFPSAPRHGLPAFAELLQAVSEAWRTRRDEIDAQNGRLSAALARTVADGATASSAFMAEPLAHACAHLAAAFDEAWGGFGEAPKFPHATDLDLLLRVGTPQALTMAATTLTRMADGGLFDQIGGGFYRYAVDARWQIPHFEKMLYDNALLLRVYADAWTLTGDARYREVVEATAAWVMREMQAGSGGYYAALDADSAGGEGAFYVWRREELSEVLAADEAALASAHWGLAAAPTVDGEAWHLRVAEPLAALAAGHGLAPAVARARIESARARLFAARAERPRPPRDEKILCAWNALMIEAMTHAARVFGRPEWRDSAERALAFLRRALWRDGRLYAVAGADGSGGRLAAYLDDHAFLLAALLEGLQDDFQPERLDFACELADTLLGAFADVREDGRVAGFFFTRHDHEALLLRAKPAYDQATPSGNAVAARALWRLAQLCGETRWNAAVEGTLALFHDAAARAPEGFASYLLALAEWQSPPTRVVVRGPRAQLPAWQALFAGRHCAGLQLAFIANDTDALPPALAMPASDPVNAWVCRRVTCLPPESRPEALIDALFKAEKVK